jgi:hypothetical protein
VSAAIVDTHLLLRVLLTALAASLGVAVVFSVAVFGITRYSDLRREQRTAGAAGYAVLGAAGLALTAAVIVYGLILLARKS